MADNVGTTVRSFGCLLIVAVVGVIAVGAFMLTRANDSALDKAWATLTPTARNAYCGSIQRDPSFDGSAGGLASLAGGDVTQYDAKRFLFDTCPLSGNPPALPAGSDDREYTDSNGNGAWDVGEPWT